MFFLILVVFLKMCGGTDEERKESVKKSKIITEQLKKEGRKLNQKIKLLLLGTGESGKSTFAKQMQIIHLNGFKSVEDRLKYKPSIYSNIIDNTRALLDATPKKFGLKLSPQNEECAARIWAINNMGWSTERGLGDDVCKDVKAIWRDPAIQEAFTRSADFQLNDSAEYFFEEIDRLSPADYIPTTPDILRCRIKTSGIHEIEFTIGRSQFRLVDVGGQRSERRKWIHCFEDVTAIIFCASMSEYDQKLQEDDQTNRMMEALKLFKDICISKWFKETAIILFLNKKDIFEKKIEKVPLTLVFENYKGGSKYAEASEYIEQQFLKQNPISTKQIYAHKTVATDTDNVKVVFWAVKDVIMNAFLEKMGLGLNGGAAVGGMEGVM